MSTAKKRTTIPSSWIKIGEAAKILGVSIKTLRRWEKEGKIDSTRTPGQTRLYSRSKLEEINPQNRQSGKTLNLLESNLKDFPVNYYRPSKSIPLPANRPRFTRQGKPLKNSSSFIPWEENSKVKSTPSVKINRLTAILIFTTFFVFLLGAFTFFSFLHFSPLPHPTQSTLASTHTLQTAEYQNVLGEQTEGQILEINADTQIKGTINGLTISSTDAGITLTDPKTQRTFTISGNNINLDQSFSPSSTPTIEGLNLSAIKNQIVVGSGTTGTLTWTPTGTSKTITLPNITDTLVGKTTTDTLSNKTIKSGDSNTISGSFPDITGITSLGTVSTGTWNGTKISTGYGGTGLTSYTKGDLIYSSASDTLAKLNIGASGKFLTVVSGIPSWGDASVDLGSGTSGTLTVASGGIGTTTLTQYGLLYGNGTSAVSTTSAGTSGQLILANSSQVPTFVTLSGAATISSTGVLTLANSTGQNLTTSSTPTFAGLYTTGNIGIGTTSPTYNLDITGNANITGALTVSGSIVGTGAVGGWSRDSSNGIIYTSTSSDKLGIGTTSPGSQMEIKAASTNAALTLKGASSGSNNIFQIQNNAGTSTYFSVDSTGQLSGSAFQITDASNAVVGTAIAGGWSAGGNTYTYRRVITVTNNDESNSLPSNYQISVSLNSNDSNQVYTKSQTSSPYKDFRIFYSADGSTFSEIGRNVSSFTSSSIAFTYQLQASIAASGSSSKYYIYYGNSTITTTPSTYTGNVQMDAFDDYSTYTSGDTAFVTSNQTSDGTATYTALANAEGSNSLKAIAMVDRMNTLSTTSQGQLSSGLKKHAVLTANIGGTDYLYVFGGNNGTTDQTTVYKSTISSANAGAFSTTSQGQLGTAISGATVNSVTAVDGGTGADGAIDLTNGSDAGGCTGTGLSWTAGTSTCTIATATKSTFNFTTVNIPSGTTLTTDGPKTTTNFVTIKATGNVTVAGTINLAGKGYSGGSAGSNGYGPGAGGNPTTYSNMGGGGGGFGGAGGNGGVCCGSTAAGGSTYTTTDSGSGGGSGDPSNSNGGAGGAGGGGIKISSVSNVTISGTVNANGGGGASANDSGGGGGSGGKIWVQGAILTISGSLTANGGNGGNSDGGNGGSGGGGGGGRLTFEYTSSIDTTGSTLTVTAGSRGPTGAPSTLGANGSAGALTQSAVSPYVYVLGGTNGSTTQSAVYYTTIDSSANIGSFSTNANALPQALHDHTSLVQTVSGTNYVYVLGGNNGTADQLTVYRSTVGSDGTLGTFATTDQGQLPQALSKQATAAITISGTTYIYVLGGINGSTVQTTVYKSTISSANIGSFSTTSQGQLPVALQDLQAVTTTVGSVNYIYVFGGNNGTADVSTIYRATIDASGNIGSFSSVGHAQLPQVLSGHTVTTITISSTPYYYTIGGTNGSTAQTTVYKSTLTSDETNFNISKTISSVDLSNKNSLQFKFYSNSTAANLMEAAFSEDGTTWQTTTFTSSQANTWETKTWDISAIASASKDAVTRLRFKINSAQSTEVTAYLDNLNGLMNASTISNTASYAQSILGASNLAINAQGTGLVQINYAASPNPQAGSGGFAVYNGTTTPWFVVASSGNVGIGTTAPSAPLEVKGSGTGAVIAKFTDGNTTSCAIGTDGTIVCSSDLALKKNIADLDFGLSTLMSLHPVEYNWKTQTEGTQKNLGFIAQEVETLIPNLVTTDSKTGYKQLNTIGMIPVLTKAMQQLNLQVSTISGQLASLTSVSSATTTQPSILGEASSSLTSQVASLSARLTNLESQTSQMSQRDHISSASALLLTSQMDEASSSAQTATSSATIAPNLALNLTAPDLLIATASAQLVNLTVVSQATVSGQLLAYESTIQNTFKSLGQTFLGNTTVAGDLSVDGTTSITGDSITTIGTLYLQNGPFSRGIDLFNGQVKIDNTGKLSVQKLVISAKTLGTAVITVGQTKTTIYSNQITPTSKVFITPHKPTAIGVTNKVNGSSFTVEIDTLKNYDLVFDWWIVDTE